VTDIVFQDLRNGVIAQALPRGEAHDAAVLQLTKAAAASADPEGALVVQM
jgi:hypothetical protein